MIEPTCLLCGCGCWSLWLIDVRFYNFTLKETFIYLCSWKVNFEGLFWIGDVD